MHFTAISTAIAATLPLASAGLNKPIINPQFPNNGLGSLGPGLMQHLRPAKRTWDKWGPGWIPEDCKNLAKSNNLSPFDITPFNIHYEDCPDSWVFCRHKDSPLSETDMMDLFGRMPVKMRSYIRHIIALPGSRSAGSAGDNIQMNGDCEITVFVHETGHSLDSHAFDPKYGAPFSNSRVWLDNYGQDSAVCDGYAQSSQQENLAQETVVGLFDKVVPGGVGTVQPNWKAIFHQYATVQGYLGDQILPGGTCSHRLANSRPVPMGDSKKSRRGLGPEPDVSLSSHVTEIEPIAMGDAIVLTQYNDAGEAIGKREVALN
ncbi:hypothetical protein LLEC1_00869 [Akanthomyces lecanii]|uniref:Conidiation-specific protein 13 n=1 Tax=Cordyceps confragosa TaxID=2714763 RepID=A0A179IIY9_CORDF|nr:hypothetical protein LLEC1_00869 [Akanthomyces lecanii]